MGWIGSIFSFLSGLFSFLHDRKVVEGAKAEDKIATQEEVLEAVKDAENIRDKPTLPDDLPTDDKPGNNVD